MDKLLTKEFLEEQYIKLNKSLPDLSKEFGIGKSTISKYLKIHGIKKNNSLRCKNLSKTLQNKSEEEKKLIKEKLSKSLFKVRDKRINSLKKSWKNKSEEELSGIKSKIKKTNLEKYGVENFNQLETQKEHKRNLWKNKSELEKLQYGNKIRDLWKNKSEEDFNKFISKIKDFWNNKSDEEKLQYCKNLKEKWDNKSDEEKLQYCNNIRKIWGNKTPEELDSFKEELRDIWKNKSDEELKQIASKISSSNKSIWKIKSDEERLKWCNFKRENGISLEQYQTLNNKDKFKQYLIEYKDNNGDYPTPDILKEKFNFSNTSGVLLYIHKYSIEDYILWGRSSPEQEVYDYVKNIYGGEVIRNNRSILPNNKELDIYIPEKQLAIEFNGCYWHSKLYLSRFYHQDKSKECLGKGIRLIHIYEDEWVYKQDIIKDILKTALGVFENKIYARKCEVKVVDKQTYKNMCQYHLQGYSPAQIILGLYYQDQLIQLASFSKSRYDKNYEYEWIRGVQLPGYQIVGGTSKLFKYFINNYNPTSIICYSDFNKFSGNSYKNCGFNLDKITTPDMWFNEINGLKRINRQPSKHQLTKQLVESGDLLEMHGAGNMKWVWRK